MVVLAIPEPPPSLIIIPLFAAQKKHLQRRLQVSLIFLNKSLTGAPNSESSMVISCFNGIGKMRVFQEAAGRGFLIYVKLFLQLQEFGKAGQPAGAEKLLKSPAMSPQAVSPPENFGRCFSAPAGCPAFPLFGYN